MDAKAEGSSRKVQARPGSVLYRYGQLILLAAAPGVIYPVMYLRQVYQTSMVAALSINDQQLGYLTSMLGTAFMLCYLPSGWLADRVSSRVLLSFSLLGSGALALWYAMLPSFYYLLIVFCGFGLTAGLTFWAALVKRVKQLAGEHEQGRFFGFLEGGRGVFEGLLATAAITLFVYHTKTQGESLAVGLQQVIRLYAYACIALGFVLAWVPDPIKATAASSAEAKPVRAACGTLLADLKLLAGVRELWLVAAIVFCGYHFFWATYTFSAYLENSGLGLTAAMAGIVTTIKLWMRPIGSIGGGWLGDRFTNLRVLAWAFVLVAGAMVGLIALPSLRSVGGSIVVGAGIAIVIFYGLMTYAIRGLYWVTLEHCPIPARMTGLAIGLVSVIGFSPDALVPLINGWVIQHYPGRLGYQIYLSYVLIVGTCGLFAVLALKKRVEQRNAA